MAKFSSLKDRNRFFLKKEAKRCLRCDIEKFRGKF